MPPRYTMVMPGMGTPMPDIARSAFISKVPITKPLINKPQPAKHVMEVEEPNTPQGNWFENIVPNLGGLTGSPADKMARWLYNESFRKNYYNE